MHIASLLILTTTTLTLTSALPHSTPPVKSHQSPADILIHQQRIAAFRAQKPLHTTALLAGAAAATPSAGQADKAKRRKEVRVRDLKSVTGEDGLWISLEDMVERDGEVVGGNEGDEDEEDEEGVYRARVEQQVVMIERREGWDGDRNGDASANGYGHGSEI